MSKKNKLSTKKKQHLFDLRREKELAVKKQIKKAKKDTKDTKARTPQAALPVKSKAKGIRIKKGVVVKGIKITDAASKKKARELLAAEQALRHMDVETPPSKKTKSKAVPQDSDVAMF